MWAALIMLSAAALGADPAVSAASAQLSTSAPAGRRPYHEIEAELRQLMRGQVQARTEADKAAIVMQQCALHAELVCDTRLETSVALKSYRNELAARLRKTASSMKQQLKRAAVAGSIAKSNQVVAADLESSAEVEASLTATLQLTDFALASPQQLFANGGAAQQDLGGAALVELIERTLHPQFWDRAGGPGKIVYYAPLQCLVVRATSEVHERTGNALGELRKGGK